MKLTSIREAACIQGINLLNQLSAKKGYKNIAPEINNLSEYFGLEFDKHVYKSLIEEIDFKDQKLLEKNKNTSNKLQFLIQEFPNFLKKPDFINMFSQILNIIITNCSAKEIFEGLTKLLRLNLENQFKILISFFYTSNEKFQKESISIFVSKCQDFDQKSDKISKEIIQQISLLINSVPELRNETFLRTSFINNIYYENPFYKDEFNYKENKLEYIEEYEKLMSDSYDEESIPFEKLLMELGPFIINNNINLTKCGLIDFNIDEKRFVNLLIYLCKSQTYTENKDSIGLNKFFLKSLQDVSFNIEENNEKKTVNWNIDNIFKLFKPHIDSLNIETIFSYLDDPLFSIRDKKSFEFLLNALNKIKPMNFLQLFYNLIFKKWNNELNQIEFINFLINLNQSELFNFKYAPRKVKKISDFLSPTNKNVSIYYVDTWSCLDLIEILIKLSKGNYYLRIREIFEWPIQNIPEILIVTLSHFKADEDDFIYYDIVNDILPNSINNSQNSTNVIEEVWNTNNELLIQALCYTYRNNPDVLNLSKILDLTQKLKDSLIQVTTCSDHNFTVNLGILSAKRDYLRLEQWLSERISTVGDDFIAALLNYLKENIINQCKDLTNQVQKENILEKSQLSLDSLAKIFENLSGSKIKNNPKVSKYMQSEISQTFHPIMELFEELQTHPPNSEEIEEEANKFFNNLFINENYTEIINILIQYKSSQNQRESEIYACMVHCLLDEYRFLQSYPDKELKLMAILFGQMIQNSLLDGILESIALKYVLEGIKKGSGKMLTFGVIALEQFIDKVNNWQNYVNLLYSEKTVLSKANPKIWQKIEEKYNEIFNKNKPTLPDNQLNKNLNNVGQNNNLGGNYINFDGEKKIAPVNNNLSSVPKMAKVQEGEFFNNYNTLNKYPYNMTPNNNQFMNYIPGQTSNFKQAQIPQSKDNANPSGTNNMFYQQNINFYPPEMNNVYMNNNPFFNNFPQQENNKKFIPNNPINNPNLIGVKNDKEFFKEDVKDSEYGLDSRLNRFKSGDKEIQQNLSTGGKQLDEYDLRNKSSKASEDSGKLPIFPKDIIDPDISSFNSSEKGLNNQTQPRLKLNPNVANKQLNLLAVLKNEIESVPPQEIIDKVNLIFNSLSKANLNEKSSELKKIILNNENVLRWFSKFFILHRIVNEMNYHYIYRDLIEQFQSKELHNLLINDTISIIKKLLTSETILESSEKNFLKHLGNWLGLMTLARNKPILAKDLDLKEIIFEAYENGRLMAVVPLVIKILENSSKTKVFHPKNPWIIAILSVLKELSQKSNFKKQIYYEIENLFKKLEVDIKSIPETKDLELFNICQNSNDFYKNDDPGVLSSAPAELKVNDLFQIISSGSLDQYIYELLNLMNQIDYSKQINKTDITFILALALCNAINEILAPVVDRAVNISLVTTRDLVLKDFSLEKDEKKFKNAAYLCIKSLAGSLAMVTCKEPLRTNFTSNLKEQLIKKGYDSELLNEQLNNNSNNANSNEILEIGCNYIQNYVVKRAIDKIDKDKTIKDELLKRKNQKPEEKNDMLKKMKNLPDLLRPNMNGLTLEQYRIYEDFDKVYEINKKDTQKNIAFIRMIIPAVKEYFDTLQYQMKMAVKNYELCMKNIELLYNKNENIDISEDDENLSQLSKIISDSKLGNDIVIELLQTNFKYIIIASKFTNPSLLIIYSEILKGWVKIHPMLSKEATLYLMKHEELDIRFKYSIHYHFIKKGIFDLDFYESCLLNLLKDPLNTQPSRKLIESLICSKVIKELKIIPSYMYDSSSSVYYDNFFNKTTLKQMMNLSFLTDAKLFNIKDPNSLLQYKEKMVHSFREVMKHIYIQETQEVLKYTEVTNLKNEDHVYLFIVLITENAIQNCFSYNESNVIYNDRLNFNDIDTLTSFCFWLIRYLSIPNKLKYFETILFSFFKAFHLNYTKNINTFNQRPFYRIFMNICFFFYNNSNEPLFLSYKKFYFYFVLADFLKMIKPQNYPGFAFAWLDIISSKYFSSIFFENEKSGESNMPIKYEKYISLILELFNFLRHNANEKFRDNSQRSFLNSVYKFLYSLLKTYPEFLSYYYLPLINALGPYNFCQLKNIILSATPNDIEQPDPYISEFKIDTLPEIKNCPQYLFNINYMLNDLYSTSLEDYFKTKNEKFLDEMIKNLNKKDTQSNYQTINLICSYILQKNINMDRNQKVAELYEIFSKLLICLNCENRDLFINALINELRFPNKHTFFTVVTFLNLLKDIKNETIEENLLKNLYERLLCKPFSWGVYVTYFEINKYIGKMEFQKKSFLKNLGVDKFLEDMNKYVSESKLNKSLNNFISS